VASQPTPLPPPSGTPVYGEFVGVYDIDEVIIDILKTWIQSWLNEVARRTGEPFARMRKPRSYRASHEIEFMPEDQRPCVAIVCTSPDEVSYVTGGPTSDIGKRLQMIWNYDIAVQVSAQGKKNDSVPRAHRLAMMYCVAIRGALMNGETDKSKKINAIFDWLGEEPGTLDSDADRTTCIGIVHFNVTVPTAATMGISPTAPEDVQDPEIPVWPWVETYDLQITKWPTEEPFPSDD